MFLKPLANHACACRIEISIDRWADDLRLSDRRRGAEVRPKFSRGRTDEDHEGRPARCLNVPRRTVPANVCAGQVPAASAFEGRDRCRSRGALPGADRSKLGMVVAAYARSVMYLKCMVAGSARVDLDANE